MYTLPQLSSNSPTAPANDTNHSNNLNENEKEDDKEQEEEKEKELIQNTVDRGDDDALQRAREAEAIGHDDDAVLGYILGGNHKKVGENLY